MNPAIRLAHQQLAAGCLEDSLASFRLAIEHAPSAAELRCDLAAVLGRLGRHAEAAGELAEAVRLRPDLRPAAHHNLGVALEALGRAREAVAAYGEAIRLRPGWAEAHNHLGNALRTLGRLSDAEAGHREAIRLRADYAAAHRNLAVALAEQGRAREAADAHRAVAQLRPDDPRAGSDLLFTIHYDEAVTPEALFEAHLAWARRHAEPLAPKDPLRWEGMQAGRPHHNEPPRLRVGYVSADFRRHAGAVYIGPVLANHDHAAVEVFCYSDVTQADETTARLRGHADVWRETARLSDEQFTTLVRADRVDVLVDLTGHMPGNRLPAFARRAAPVQVSYPGYPNTTGMRAMDYLLTDADRAAAGAEGRFTERLVRLPVSGQCYQPPADAPDVGPLPALASGRVTFGCLNKLVKVTPGTLRLWGRIMAATPGSRLIVLYIGAGVDEAGVRARFAAAGVPSDADRLAFAGRLPHRAYLDVYNRIDVALDTFPYNGHTTTLDATWMGTATVTLAGPTHATREGAAVLGQVGLSDLIATSAEAYVRRAVELATDLPRLAALRAELRERMRASPLCNGPRLARALEGKYQHLWREWRHAGPGLGS